MASPNNFDFPYVPPPPHQPFRPPPPPSKPPTEPPPRPFSPPQPPPPPAPSPGNHTTVIVVVFVSLGGLLFLAFLAAGLCCLVKKRKKKTAQETDIVRVDEHLKVREAILPGPQGPRPVILSVEDDVRVNEVITRNEKVGAGLHAKKSSESNPASDLEGQPSSSWATDHHLLERKP